MSARSFRSFKSAPAGVSWSEAQIVDVARGLLDEHVTARESAARLLNSVCGNCQGSGNAPSTLMPGEFVPCFACEGTGKPNDKVQACPEMTPADNERIWKIGQLLRGPHRVAIVALIKERYPDLYQAPDGERPN